MPTELPPWFDEFWHPEVSSIPEDWEWTWESTENEPQNLTRAEQDRIHDELDELFRQNEIPVERTNKH